VARIADITRCSAVTY